MEEYLLLVNLYNVLTRRNMHFKQMILARRTVVHLIETVNNEIKVSSNKWVVPFG